MANIKIHELSDGSKWTAPEIAAATGMSITSVRNRLCRSKDRDKVFTPILQKSGKGFYKLYTLSDGSQWTIPEIVKKIGITKSCAGARLASSRDVKRVLRPPAIKGGIEMKKVRKHMADRMCYNDRDFWKTFNANT
jgi:hypothetical protein